MSQDLLTENTPLGASEVFRSRTIDLRNVPAITSTVTSDAAGTLQVQFSADRTNWDSTLTYPYTPGTNFAPHGLQVARRYMRVVYTNGGTPQGYFRLQIMGGQRGPLTSPLNSMIEQGADAIVTRSISEEVAIAQGLFGGHAIVNKFGRNPNLTTGNMPADIWQGNGLYTGFPTGAAETIEVLSGDANDTAAGTGARTVQIYGLDDSGLEVTATVTLNGTTPVAVPTILWSRCNRGIVRSAGSGEVNAGTITIRHTTTTANVFASIPPGVNQTEICCYTIPAGKTGYLRGVFAYLNRQSGGNIDREADTNLVVRPQGEVFQVKLPISLSSRSPLDHKIYGGFELPALSDVSVRIFGMSTTNSDMTAKIDILLVDN